MTRPNSKNKTNAVKPQEALEEEKLLEDLDKFKFEEAEPNDSAIMSAQEAEEESEPDIDDPDWNEFVMSRFMENELRDGKPLVHGLRRVVQRYLGPVLESEVDVVKPAHLDGSKTPLHCTMKARIKVLMTKGYGAPYEMVFSDVADVTPESCDALFLRYPSATCATRAEARTLRKLLRLRTCAAEEIGGSGGSASSGGSSASSASSSLNSSTPQPEEGFIKDSQITFLNNYCKRADIDVIAFLQSGKQKFKNIHEVPYETAVRMLSHLSTLENDRSKITENIKGYKKDWRK